MRKIGLVLLNFGMVAAVPMMANAAGTYYNGNLYQNPQNGYAGVNMGYNNPYGMGRGYGQANQSMMVRTTSTKTTKKSSNAKKESGTQKQGLYLDLGFSHEFADWKFEMNDAGSKLHYDNLAWNVFGADGAYYFGDSTPMQIKLGAKYGIQFDESPMVDDDISSGAYGYQDIAEGREYGHAMSVGTSSGGSQMGFYASFGLTNFFNWGRVKVTPSIGYRYFKYELETKNNYGLTMDTFSGNSYYDYISCIEEGGELQCDPLVIFGFYDGDGDYLDYVVAGRLQNDDGTLTSIFIPVSDLHPNTEYISVDMGDTYYYYQSGVSHKYETKWAGPYLALDLEYVINDKNAVLGGIEFGLPIYESTGNQPYRIDWAHPTSVEDKGSFGDAYHLGLNTMWSTQVSDSINLTLGFTYDFYKVTGATAKTYLNQAYHQNKLDGYEEDYLNWVEYIDAGNVLTEQEAATYNELIDQINYMTALKNSGWTMESKNEIDSIYKAMGIRVGVNIKF